MNLSSLKQQIQKFWAQINRARWGLMTGALLMTGCAQEKSWVLSTSEKPTVTRAADEEAKRVKTVKADNVEEEVKLTAVEEVRNEIPITLDAVLRLAQGKNKQIAIARERLHESLVNQEIADQSWIPAINVGVCYYRHEGGIQD